MNPLALLASSLRGIENDVPSDLRECTEINDVLQSLEGNARTRGSAHEPKDLQIEAVKKFAVTGKLESLREARLLSFGLGIRALENNGCLLEDGTLFGKALESIDSWKGIPRQFRKCYQGLVRSYFDYDGLARGANPSSSMNWQSLRSYLDGNATHINDARINPEWVTCVQQHRNVFSGQPCQAYGADLLAGNEERIAHVRSQLGINDSSWFTRELIMSQVVQATRLGNTDFCRLVSGLLKLVASNEVLRDRALNLLLDRYAAVTGTPPHQELKDQAVAWWGNPWLPSNTDRWGGVTEQARAMVSDWLKLEFIELFFSKLAEDGQSDTRRVKFWAKYVPSIENIQFALGPHARSSREKDFVELRKKMQGLIVPLEDNIRERNAFIMTMGDLVAVEFSKNSNAFYGYSVKKKLPFEFNRPLQTPVDGLNSLKSKSRELWLSHQDNIKGYWTWEDRFEAELLKSFGLKPGQSGLQRAVRVQLPKVDLSTEQLTSSQQAQASSKRQAPTDHFVQKGTAKLGTATDIAEPARSSADYLATFKRQVFPNTLDADIQKSAPKPNQKVDLPWKVSSVFDLGKSLPASTPTASDDAEVPGYTEAKLESLASEISAGLVDQRAKGGALWLKADEVNSTVKKTLTDWGFKYVPGKGWWKR
jgi:hypothetical protein